MIATLINFCTTEASFLHHCIQEALCFSDQVIVSVCDHFFDGTKENEKLLSGIFHAHPQIEFVLYPFSGQNFYGSHSSHYWHNLGRMVALSRVKKEIPHVLFLDADEILEGERLVEWLKTFAVYEYEALTFACYWYFRKSQYRAKTLEDSPLLVHKGALHYDALMHPHERRGIFAQIAGKKRRYLSERNPLAHHYSWVRSKEGLLRKVGTWGHRGERDWAFLIEEEFSRPFSGKDFVHGYTFETVEPYLEPHSYVEAEGIPSNVTVLSTRDVHKIDLTYL